MNKILKNNVLTGLIVLAFVGMIAVGVSKYDKMPILDDWKHSQKVAKSMEMDSTKEILWAIIPAQTYIEPFTSMKNNIKDSLANYFIENTNY